MRGGGEGGHFGAKRASDESFCPSTAEIVGMPDIFYPCRYKPVWPKDFLLTIRLITDWDVRLEK